MMNNTLSQTVIGATGMGKTAFLHNQIMEDIKAGRSSIVFDPHGDLTTDVLESLPSDLADRVAVLSVDEDMPFGLNLYECDNRTSSLAVSRTVDNAILVFKRLMQDERGFHPHIEYLLRNLGYTLLANPDYTLAEAGFLFEQSEEAEVFRFHLLRSVNNRDVHGFWKGLKERSKSLSYQYIEPLLNKISPFTTNDVIRLIVGQTETTIPFSDYLDQPGKTLLIHLPIGILGEEMTQALGMMLLSVLSEQIYERVRQRQSRRTPLHLYIDELGRFATSGTAVSKLLTEGRKFGLATTLAFQTFAQLPDKEAESAVLQVGSLVIFGVIGGYDAEILTKQLRVTSPPVEPVPRMRMIPNMIDYEEDVWDDPLAQREYERFNADYDSFYMERYNNYKVLDDFAAYPPNSPQREKQEKKAAAIFAQGERMEELKAAHCKHVKGQRQDGWLPVKTEEEREKTTRYTRSGTIPDSRLVEKEQQLYDMVAGQPRPFSDLWNEMQMTLATLDPYHCYTQSINESHEITETHLVTTPPPEKQPYGEAQTEEIMERSRCQFGTPADEVRQQMFDRIKPFLEPPKDEGGATANPPNKPKGSPPEIERGKPYKKT